MYNIFQSYSKGDRIIAFSVMIQPMLVVLQFIMISVFFIPEDQTTKYRVVLTAIPMILAILVGLTRKFPVFFFTYLFLFLFLGMEMMLFPANSTHILSDSFRFMVPVIIPSIICLSCLKNISIIEDVIYFYSWFIIAMVLLFVVRFLQGNVDFQSYNMGLSYALLLPMITLYKRGGLLSYMGGTICFMSILIFGSRGALVVGVLYVIYDLIQKNKKNLYIILIISFSLVNIAIIFGDYLESLGISSRTLNFIIGGGMTSAEGRDLIYDRAINLIQINWITGLGIYGDRTCMNDEYCHNIILEFWVDYGVIIGSLFFATLIYILVRLYLRLDSLNRNVLLKYTIVLFVPFFASSSYLIDCNFGVFWGIVFLMYNTSLKKGYVFK